MKRFYQFSILCLQLFVLFGFVANSAAGVKQSGNIVYPGSTATFNVSATGIACSVEWEVLNSAGSTVATYSSPNGWNVLFSSNPTGEMLTVTAPSNAPLGSGYQAVLLMPPPEFGVEATFSVSAPLPPPSPTNLTATAGGSSVSLSWTASIGATSYTVYYGKTNGGPYPSSQSGITGTSCTISSLTNGTTYYFVVVAVNSYGPSGYSNQVSATPTGGTHLPPPPPPSAPTALVAYPGNMTVALVWLPVSGATSYQAFMALSSGGPFRQVGMATVPNCEVSRLTNGTTYYFVVEAVNGGQNSGNSNVAQATPTAARVPIGIVPNPQTGYLPDALALPEWEEVAIPKDRSDAPGGGPSSILSVSEPFGVVEASSGVDIVMDDPVVGQIGFGRQYRTALAAGNIFSPGLPAGWTHNYDYRLYAQTPAAWGPIQLVYPNGASETLTPVSGPTGAFTVPANAPYVATGVPSSTTGVWTSITLLRNGLEQDVFTLATGDSAYRLTTIVNDAGSQTNLTYSSGELTNIASSSASGAYTGPPKNIALTYIGGLLASVAATGSGTVRYAYSGGELASVTNVDGGSLLWSYGYTAINAAPYLSSVQTQGSTGSASVAFSSITGEVSVLTDANNRGHSYTYSGLDVGSSSGTTTVQTGNGVDTHTDLYDGLGRVSRITNAAGHSSNYSWLGGRLLNAVLPSGQGYFVTRDSAGNPTSIVDPSNCKTTLTWVYPAGYPFGQLMSVAVTGRDGSHMSPTTYQYYASSSAAGQLAGYVSSVTYPSGQIVNYTYTPLGQILSGSTVASDGTPISTNVGYGSANGEVMGEPTKISDPLNLTTLLSYPSDLVYQAQDPLGFTIAFTTNANRQVVSVLTPDGVTTSLGYVAPSKNLATASVAAPGLGSQTLLSLGYDGEYGNTGAQSDPLQTVTTADDSEYELAMLLNGNQVQMHTLSWDPFAQVESYTVGSFGTGNATPYSSTLNQDGVPTAFSGPNYTGTIGLDAGDVPGAIQWAGTGGAGGALETYSYDGFNRLSSSSSSTEGTHSYTYDSAGRVLVDSSQNGLNSLSYLYAPNGARSTMTVNTGGESQTFTYTYDHDGRVINIAVNSYGAITNVSYLYDNDGRVWQVQTPYVTTLYQYDAGGRVTVVQNLTPAGVVDDSRSPIVGLDGYQHSIFSTFSGASTGTSPMTFDINSNLHGFYYYVRAGSVNNWYDFTGSASYTFASATALSSETWNGGSIQTFAYGLDPAENLTTLRGEAFTTNVGSDQLTSSTNTFGTPVTYDAQGNMTAFRNLTASYSVQGALTQLGTSTFRYDTDGRLQTDESSSSDGGSFVYDGDDLVAHGSSVYIWGPTGPVVEIDGPNASDISCLTYDPNGSLVERISVDALSNYVIDGPFLFDAYGVLVPGAPSPPTTPVWNNSNYCPFQYKGQAGYVSLSPSSRVGSPTLVNCENRWYDPLSGRFVSRDPTGLDGGENAYEFCDGNPLMLVDPSGLESESFADRVLSTGRAIARGTVDGVKHFATGVWQSTTPYFVLNNDWHKEFTDPIGYEADLLGGLWNGLKLQGSNLLGHNGTEGFVDSATQLALAVASAKVGGGGACFAAGTQVLMADGSSKPIETVTPGDFVFSRSESLGPEQRPTPERVLSVPVSKADDLLLLEFSDGGSLTRTREHKFFVPEIGFVPAGALRVGELISAEGLCKFGALLRVNSLSGTHQVFNLTVEKDHTYFVRGSGGAWLWVHNECETYTLVAKTKGFRPVYVRGFSEPQGGVFMNPGETWKYGESINPSKRYSKAFLEQWGLGLGERTPFGTKPLARASQIKDIISYFTKEGKLPPGNKIKN